MKYLLWLTSRCGHLAEIVNALRKDNHEIGILLAQDGVFLLDQGCEESSLLKELGTKIYAISDHAEERGLKDRLVVEPTFVDFAKAVDLMMEQYERIISI
jgi:sulfur relay protein TusB/DsrH